MAKERTITRRMNTVLDDLESEFKIIYSEDDFKRKIKIYEKAALENTSDAPSKLSELIKMFDEYNLKVDKSQSPLYYRYLLKQIKFQDLPSIEEHFINSLYDKYENFPSPEKFMERLVNRLTTDESWNKDSTRLKILKQFIKYGNFMEYRDLSNKLVKIYHGQMYIRKYAEAKKKVKLNNNRIEDVIEHLDEGVFYKLEEIRENIRSNQGESAEEKKMKNRDSESIKTDGKYGLLRVADDLANGNFRSGGSTKKDLYVFAMTFGMTYYTSVGNDLLLDYETDVELNLFRDYYNINLMKDFSDNAYENKVSGQGINYKNFAEVVYLYYISKGYSPEDKLRLSSEMIKRLEESHNVYKVKSSEVINHATAEYRKFARGISGEWDCEDIFLLSEVEFEDFISKEYDCNTNRKISTLELQREQRSAFEEYTKIMNWLEKNIDAEKDIYGLWFTDKDSLKIGNYQFKGNGEIKKEEKIQEFLNVLTNINDSFLLKIFPRIEKAENVSRASLIASFYYYFNCLREFSDKKTFSEVYDEFKNEADPILTRAYYQPINSKSIFDLLVIFSSYAYFNLN